jgi:hypothetical protein
MYIPFDVICLTYVHASPPRYLTKSCLCVVLLEAPKNAQSITFLAFYMEPMQNCANRMGQFILLAEEDGL